ncbi:MAG: HD domain-containing protein [Lachnospiraceae bacterium]|nr:HD domain-containing protein [Lachnospiraceae bacterium]
MEEMFEIIEPDGSFTGRLKPRSQVHRDGDLHGASHIWVYRLVDGKAELLLQKRSDTKDSFPGCFDTSSAGHLDPGEDFKAAAIRELNEELGIQASEKELQYMYRKEIDLTDVFYGESFHNHELISVYMMELVPADRAIHFQESEISGVMWMEVDTLCRMVKEDLFMHCIDAEELNLIAEELHRRLRLNQQMKFLLEADREKEIIRQTYKTSMQKENDAEHAWHLALMVMLLSEHANAPVDSYRTMCMVLIHDLVEIDAGDTYAYDSAGAATQKDRENAAADRIFNLLPADQADWIRKLWDEFEAWETPEACFAHTLDNLQPLMLNDATDGKSWKEHHVKKEQPMKRNARSMEGSERLWNYIHQIIRSRAQKGDLE